MNPDPLPFPENPSEPPPAGLYQTPAEATPAGSRVSGSLPGHIPNTRSFTPDPGEDGFAYEAMKPDPDYYEPDSDYAEFARDQELRYQELAADSDNFARSDDDGWFYSDDD